MELFDSGLKYCGINTARSALSSLVDDIIGCSVGNLPLVKRLLKGTYHLRPNEGREVCARLFGVLDSQVDN